MPERPRTRATRPTSSPSSTSTTATSTAATRTRRSWSPSTNHYQENSQKIPSGQMREVSSAEFRHRLNILGHCLSDLSDRQRTIALAHIQPYMGASQWHWLASQLPDLHCLCPQGCLDFFSRVDDNVILAIFALLDPVSLAKTSQVCRRFNALASSPFLWRRLALSPKYRLSEDLNNNEINENNNNNNERSRKEHKNKNNSWKSALICRFKLRRSWLLGQCHVRTFEGHSGAISCVQFDSTRIVSGSHDQTIRVWNVKTNSKWSVMTLIGHSGQVRCLHLQGNRLVSGSTDLTLKVWNLSTRPEWSSIGCKVTMVGHSDTVRCVQMSSELNQVISGSYDKSIKLWCLNSGQCLKTLLGHQDRILCLYWDTDNNRVYSGSSDKSVKVWCLEPSGQCLLTLNGHSDAITCLGLESNLIITGSLDRTIRLWDVHKAECVRILDWKSSEGHTGVIRGLKADKWRIVSVSDDKTIKVWSLHKGQRLVTLRSHSDGVTCVAFNDKFIVSGSYDKTIKLWDFTVC